MRVINFSAGPAGLPLPALERARDELLEFPGTGMSIMEQSHRGKDYEAVHNEAISLITELLGIPTSHQVLFLQGGAHLQFAMVPMNFLGPSASADYVVTGHWGERAVDEAKTLGRVQVTSSAQDKKYTRVPTKDELQLHPDAAYVHLTSNETIDGVQFHEFPDTGKVPLVADMSSDFMWRAFDVRRFGLIYAGAQKNLGPSGVLVVVAAKDFLATGRKDIPKVLRYTTFAENNSLYNTPPTFSIYLIRNVLSWVKSVGGLAQIEAWNRQKAALLYGLIDARPDFFRSPVAVPSRSVMNVVFRLPSEALDEKFVSEAKKAGMVGLKGHRSVGGVRVSAYNAVSVQDVKTLADFMSKFAQSNG